MPRENGRVPYLIFLPAQLSERLGRQIQVTQDLAKQTAPDIFALADRDDGAATIGVPPEGVAALLADQVKPEARQEGLQLPGREGSEAAHAGMSSCWIPMTWRPERRSARFPWTSSQSSTASRMRRMA